MTQSAIPVTNEVKFNIQIGDELTQNVKPLLHEIKHALENLIESGANSIIDLRSIPLAPGEEEKILSTLGKGEVEAQLDALGLSEIIETQYAGVWVITHYNDEGNIISRFIEVTAMPDILSSQTEDIMTAYSNLSLDLDETQETN
jgi:HupH hydrogenase expression protein, C-terminal conserved region